MRVAIKRRTKSGTLIYDWIKDIEEIIVFDDKKAVHVIDDDLNITPARKASWRGKND